MYIITILHCTHPEREHENTRKNGREGGREGDFRYMDILLRCQNG